MARKEKPKYGVKELGALKGQLRKHTQTLAQAVQEAAVTLTEDAQQAHMIGVNLFDGAVQLRDKAQQLVATCRALDNIDTLIALAEHRGPQELFFDLEECGM